jgi:hypothetical protein
MITDKKNESRTKGRGDCERNDDKEKRGQRTALTDEEDVDEEVVDVDAGSVVLPHGAVE